VEACDRVCGKGLKALFPILVSVPKYHGQLHLGAAIREKLMRPHARLAK
jgi:hypothetical protein